MTEDEQRLFDGVLPLDDVDSGAIDLAGRLRRARRPPAGGARRAQRAARPIDAWAAAIAEAADALTATTRARRVAARRARPPARRRRRARPTRRQRDTTLAPAEIRALLAERLQGRPTRANFRTGHLTICTLVPMRSVPHRVVCLLGHRRRRLPAQVAARRRRPHARRPARRRPRRAHRGPPAAARRAAGRDRPADRHLHRQRRAHEPRRAAGGAGRRAARRRRPHRPHRRGGRRASASSSATRCSRSTRELHGRRARARAGVELRLASRSTARGRWPTERAQLAALPRRAAAGGDRRRSSSSTTSCASSEHPARAFLRQRLGISVGDYSDEVDDALPVELDALEQWGVGQRLLDGAARGRDASRRASPPRSRAGRCRRASSRSPVIARGPPDRRRSIAAAARTRARRRRRAGVGRRQGRARRRAHAQRDGPRRLRRRRSRTVTYSRVDARAPPRGLGALLALTAAHPERPFAAVTIGRRARGAPDSATITIARIRPLADDAAPRERRSRAARDARRPLRPRHARAAPARLHDLGRLRRSRVRRRATPRRPGASAWESAWSFPKEDADPEHQLVLGGILSLRRADRRAAARRRAGRRLGRHARRRASAATRAACGTACSHTEAVFER